MTDNNNKNIVTGLKVEFTRKNKKYIKDLSIIMTDDMSKILKKKTIYNFFLIRPIIVSHFSVNCLRCGLY
jgi:hypothetical protein